ncbi:hypothetical protein APSETT444_006153 [Aspergillus pseudonomiae]
MNGSLTDRIPKGLLPLKDKKNNFLSYWRVLQDPKYEKPASWDDNFDRALKRAQIVLQNLNAEADSKKEEMADLVKDLTAALLIIGGMADHTAMQFMMDTSANKENVDSFNQRYNKTKLKKEGKEYNSYIEYLDSDVAAATAQIISFEEQMQKDRKVIRDSEEDQMKWFWVPFWGWSNSIQMSEKVEKATKTFEETRTKLIGRGGKTMEVTRLISIIRPLCNQFDDLIGKMGTAITALNETVQLFDSQASNYSSIITSLRDMKTGVESGDFDMRDMNIEDGIKQAVESFTKVKKLAEEFRKTALLTVQEGEGDKL